MICLFGKVIGKSHFCFCLFCYWLFGYWFWFVIGLVGYLVGGSSSYVFIWSLAYLVC